MRANPYRYRTIRIINYTFPVAPGCRVTTDACRAIHDRRRKSVASEKIATQAQSRQTARRPFSGQQRHRHRHRHRRRYYRELLLDSALITARPLSNLRCKFSYGVIFGSAGGGGILERVERPAISAGAVKWHFISVLGSQLMKPARRRRELRASPRQTAFTSPNVFISLLSGLLKRNHASWRIFFPLKIWIRPNNMNTTASGETPTPVASPRPSLA